MSEKSNLGIPSRQTGVNVADKKKTKGRDVLSGQLKVNLALKLAVKLSFRPNIEFIGLTELRKAPV